MLKLRRGTVVSARSARGGGRPASGDAPGRILCSSARCAEGDEVVVNVEAMDLGLGSGGFDVVHVNLTRGLEDPGRADLNVFKLNYSSLQHPVETVEPEERATVGGSSVPVLVCFLHGQLAPAAWAAAQAAEGIRGRLRPDTGGRAARGRSRATSRSFASAGCSPAT